MGILGDPIMERLLTTWDVVYGDRKWAQQKRVSLAQALFQALS